VTVDLARGLERFGGAAATIVEANAAAQEALGPQAVLAGPYAPLLFAGARRERRRAAEIKGGPRAREGIDAARRQGYTHFALDAAQDLTGQFAEGFAREGEPPRLLVAFELRGSVVVRVYRFRHADELRDGFSAFERACELEDEGNAAGARAAFEALPLPGRRALCLARARALLELHRSADARGLLELLSPDDPDRRRLEARL
jgi:hypothetical protein